MVLKQIQPKFRLCDNVQYRQWLLRLRVLWGSAPIIDIMSAISHLLLDLSISLLREIKSFTGLQKLNKPSNSSKIASCCLQFSFSFNERAIPPVYWCKSFRYWRRPFSSARWPWEGHLLCFKTFEQNSKLLFNHKARTFGCRHLQQKIQALPFRPTLHDHYGPPGAPVVP